MISRESLEDEEWKVIDCLLKKTTDRRKKFKIRYDQIAVYVFEIQQTQQEYRTIRSERRFKNVPCLCKM